MTLTFAGIARARLGAGRRWPARTSGRRLARVADGDQTCAGGPGHRRPGGVAGRPGRRRGPGLSTAGHRSRRSGRADPAAAVPRAGAGAVRRRAPVAAGAAGPYEAWLFGRTHPLPPAGRRRSRFLARRGGPVVGRICAHHVDGDGRRLVRRLRVRRRRPCRRRPRRRGPPSRPSCGGDVALSGPATLHRRRRGRRAGLSASRGPAAPAGRSAGWYSAHLSTAGLALDRTFPRWRLVAPIVGAAGRCPRADPLPPPAGKLGRPRRLVLDGDAGASPPCPTSPPALRATLVAPAAATPPKRRSSASKATRPCSSPALLDAAAAATERSGRPGPRPVPPPTPSTSCTADSSPDLRRYGRRPRTQFEPGSALQPNRLQGSPRPAGADPVPADDCSIAASLAFVGDRWTLPR